jgi:glutamate formiminotransferase/formiminotetrahydrofolate cyclodeaminase
MEAFALPKSTNEEKAARSEAIQAATLYATEVPLMTMRRSVACLPLIKEMVNIGNPNSVTDAGVGALCIRTAVYGACLNVRINASGLKDKAMAEQLISEANELLQHTITEEAEILKMVESKM